MKKKRKNKAQSLLEYAVMIIIAVAAILASVNLLRRHIEGNWRQSADVFGGGRQFQNGTTQVTDN